MGLGLLEISVDAVVEASDFGFGEIDCYNRVGVNKKDFGSALKKTVVPASARWTSVGGNV